MAWGYFASGEKGNALECAEQALKNDPENNTVKVFIKTLKEGMGSTSE
jgi:hypothetical protein